MKGFYFFTFVFLSLIIFSGVGLATNFYLAFNNIGYTQTMFTQVASTSLILAGIGLVGYIICIIVMIPKGMLYSLAYPIAIDNPNMSAKEAVEKSAELMRGNRWKLFCLYFSFIGWLILTGLATGLVASMFIAVPAVSIILTPVLDCFILPYMFIATIIFYENLVGKLNTVEVKAEPATPVVEEAKPQEEPVKEVEKEAEEPIQNNEENNE